MSGEQPTRDPRQADLVRRIIEAAAGRVHTFTVATIVSYDASQSPPRATIRLIPCSRRRGDDGATECFRVPEIPNCPVLFPGAGQSWGVTWPLAAGDTVAVAIAERSIAEWLQTGASQTEPRDPRRHDYSDAIVLPGALHVSGAAVSGMHDPAALVVFGDAIKLGSAAATEPIALAAPLATDLGTLQSALASAAAAAGAVGSPAQWSAFASTLSAALAGWPTSAASTKVKAE